VILGNADFIAENGVVSGAGTREDPYILAGWEITVPSGEFHGVKIENVSASFVLRGLVINGANQLEGAAIRIGFASGGTVDKCTITNSVNGIEIISSTGIAVRDTVLSVTGRGLHVVGESSEEYRHSIEPSTELNGYPVLYYHDVDGETIEGQRTTHLTIAASRGVKVLKNEIVNGDGIELAFVEDSTVSENAVYRTSPVLTGSGIHLYASHRNEVTKNSLRNNRLAGIQLTLATGNMLRQNELLANDVGIRLFAADENTITLNSCFANRTGIEVISGSNANELSANLIFHENTKQGIALESATANRVERNVITNAEMGVVMEAQASNNTVANNSVISCGYGMTISGSYNEINGNLLSLNNRGILFPETYTRSTTRGNTFRGNVFSGNTSHLYTNLDSEVNWFTENVFLGPATKLVSDNGTNNRWVVAGVGNYWGETPMIDENEDGFGDTPVIVYPAGIQDTAPLASIDPEQLEVGVLATLEKRTLSLETADGGLIELATLIANEGHEQWVGFQGFPESLLSEFPGILFQYEDEGERRFHMNNVDFDLDIAYFAADGIFLDRQTMKANSEDLYTVSVPFQYALELPTGTMKEIADGSRLILP